MCTGRLTFCPFSARFWGYGQIFIKVTTIKFQQKIGPVGAEMMHRTDGPFIITRLTRRRLEVSYSCASFKKAVLHVNGRGRAALVRECISRVQ